MMFDVMMQGFTVAMWVGGVAAPIGLVVALVGRYGRPPRPAEPVAPSVMVVVRDARQAARVHADLSFSPDVYVAWASSPMTFAARSAVVVFVCEGVDLNATIPGGGSLGDLLRARQAVFGARAVFINMNEG